LNILLLQVVVLEALVTILVKAKELVEAERAE
jgi:hypothetical protein